MKIALVLYNEFNCLDFFNFYEPITRVKSLGVDGDIKWKVCALRDEASDDKGLVIKPTTIGESLDGFDVVFIPGGEGSKVLMYDDIFLSWIKGAKNSPCKVAIGSGSLLFGAAGLLKDTQVASLGKDDSLLKPYCKDILNQKIVEDKDFISGFGLDIGLYAVEKFYGKEVKEDIACLLNHPST